MFFVIAGLLILASIFLHEGGRVCAMRSRGINIQEFGLGFRVPFLPSFRTSLPFLPGAILSINPLPLGTFVKPTPEGEERLSRLPYRDYALISGSGILCNIFFGIFLGTILTMISPAFKPNAPILVLYVGVVVSISLWMLKELFSVYLVPILGVLLLMTLGVLIYMDPNQAIVGPFETAKMLYENANDLPTALAAASFVSLGLALLSMLPLYPFAGGRIIEALVKSKNKNWCRAYRRTSLCLSIVLFMLALHQDFLLLFGK